MGDVYEYGSYIGPNQKVSPPSDKDVVPNNQSSNTEKDIDLPNPSDTEPTPKITNEEIDKIMAELDITKKEQPKITGLSMISISNDCYKEPNVRNISLKFKTDGYEELSDSEKLDVINKGLVFNVTGPGVFYSETIKTINIIGDSPHPFGIPIGDDKYDNCGVKGVPNIDRYEDYDVTITFNGDKIFEEKINCSYSNNYIENY